MIKNNNKPEEGSTCQYKDNQLQIAGPSIRDDKCSQIQNLNWDAKLVKSLFTKPN